MCIYPYINTQYCLVLYPPPPNPDDCPDCAPTRHACLHPRNPPSGPKGEEDVDKSLASLWETTKKELKASLPPDDAQLIDTISYKASMQVMH